MGPPILPLVILRSSTLEAHKLVAGFFGKLKDSEQAVRGHVLPGLHPASLPLQKLPSRKERIVVQTIIFQRASCSSCREEASCCRSTE